MLLYVYTENLKRRLLTVVWQPCDCANEILCVTCSGLFLFTYFAFTYKADMRSSLMRLALRSYTYYIRSSVSVRVCIRLVSLALWLLWCVDILLTLHFEFARREF